MTVFTNSRLTALLILLMAGLIGLGSTTATAQEYKETYNAAREAALAKNYKVALEKYLEAADGAKAEGDGDVERGSRKVASQLAYILGRAELQKDQFDAAIRYFDQGIKQYPSNAQNYLARGSALKQAGRTDQAIAAFAQTMEVATAGSDTKTARQAEEAIRGHYVFLASSALSRNGARTSKADADEAMGYIQTMLQYVDADADTYYYTAESQKVKGEYENSVASADQALEVHRGSRTDAAKIYFVKGESLMNMGQIEAAKEAFRNAAYGNYRASAEHYLETLGTN
jgi:tetratricopeptide (TPR) repeat protein